VRRVRHTSAALAAPDGAGAKLGNTSAVPRTLPSQDPGASTPTAIETIDSTSWAVPPRFAPSVTARVG
jgi:hypothetical protein